MQSQQFVVDDFHLSDILDLVEVVRQSWGHSPYVPCSKFGQCFVWCSVCSSTFSGWLSPLHARGQKSCDGEAPYWPGAAWLERAVAYHWGKITPPTVEKPPWRSTICQFSACSKPVTEFFPSDVSQTQPGQRLVPMQQKPSLSRDRAIQRSSRLIRLDSVTAAGAARSLVESTKRLPIGALTPDY